MDGLHSTNRRPTQQLVDEQALLVQELFETFLNDFSSDGSSYDYREQITIMKENYKNSIYVDYTHLNSYNALLASTIESEYMRFEPSVRKGIQAFVRKYHPDYVSDNQRPDKEFWIHFYKTPSVLKLRDLRSQKIGKLTSICGTVTRTSEVRPELLFGTFLCLDCQTKIVDVEQRFKYTEPIVCKNPTCQNSSRWQLDVDNSKFVDWQKVRVQENANEIPSGAMPRNIEVILRQDAVEQAKAGDKCIFVGTLIVMPDLHALKIPGATVEAVQEQQPRTNRDIAEGDGFSGLRGLGVRELTYKLAFLACSVQQANNKMGVVNIRDDSNDDDIADQFTDEEKLDIYNMKQDPMIYRKLVKSVAPTIFGHDEVKKGILLMLFGGVHKSTPEGIQLRGDINVCVVGDPSVAKSQFLKYVTGLVPRAVYTSGKASSAAGLTATVVRDKETGDFNIEAGALMLADNGICCIDEFDKMDPTDQVAIHEAMEQQTISIAKAGIHATLNARTSILAAANPIGGRYDKSKSIKANLTITPAIMSRFDLMFVVLDKNDPSTDYNIARHIVSVHQKRDKAINPSFTQEQLQRYIRFGRTLKPKFTPAALEKVTEEYCKIRLADQSRGKTAWRITVRQLESMIRLSEALARLHLEMEIGVHLVDEASRLLRQSTINVYSDDVELAIAPIPLVSRNQQNDEIVVPDETEPVTTTTQPRQKEKISRDKFNNIKNLMLMRFKEVEKENMDNKTISQRDLIAWYLEEVSGTLEGTQAVAKEKQISRAVIASLIKEKIFQVIPSEVKSKEDRLLAPAIELQGDLAMEL